MYFFERQIISEINLREQSLWVDNKPIFFFKDWPEKGITKIKHLQRTENNGFLSLNALALKYDIKLHPLSFYDLLSAAESLRETATGAAEIRGGNSETLCDKIMKSQRPGPLIYKKLISTKGLTLSNSQNKWFQDCNH